MKKLNLKLFENATMNQWPTKVFKGVTGFFLNWLLYLDEIQKFHVKPRLLDGLEFIDEILDELEIGADISDRMLQRVPDSGAVLIVFNQPLGLLEHLLIGKITSRIRSDVIFGNNSFLDSHPQFREHSLEHVFGDTAGLESKVIAALQEKKAVIMAPSKGIAKQKPYFIQDRSWPASLYDIINTGKPLILPVFVHGRLSTSSMLLTAFGLKLRSMLPLRELFKKRGKNIRLSIGNPIATNSVIGLKKLNAVKMLQKHLIRLGNGKKGIFKTEKAVVHPAERQALRNDIYKGELLGVTEDGKKIFLCEFLASSFLMREIGRLRELTFRKMQEGTGSRIDLDEFDIHYKHLVLWDEEELELVGAYRLGLCKSSSGEDLDKLYTTSLFHFCNKFKSILSQSVEVGRSFVQEKYWNSMALDYLWQGIGAFLANNPSIKYLYGPVSISPLYNRTAQELIIAYYKKWHEKKSFQVKSNNTFHISPGKQSELASLFSGNSEKVDFKTLKQQLKLHGLSVPTLYKQYIDLCESGGAGFLAFGVDKSFGGCTDGFILVDIDQIKDKKRNRYILSNLAAGQEWRGFLSKTALGESA